MIDFIDSFFPVRTGAVAAACLAFAFLVLAVHGCLQLRKTTGYESRRHVKISAVMLGVGAAGSGIAWAVLQNFSRDLGGNDTVTVFAYVAGGAAVSLAGIEAWGMVTTPHARSAVAGTLAMLVASVHAFVTMISHVAYNTRRGELDNQLITTLRQLEFATRVVAVLLVIAAAVFYVIEFIQSRRGRSVVVEAIPVDENDNGKH